MQAMVKLSKCMRSVATNLDSSLGLTPDQPSHNSPCNVKDEDVILEEIMKKSCVFEYIPGCSHRSFQGIQCNIIQELKVNNFLEWEQKHKDKILRDKQFMDILKMKH